MVLMVWLLVAGAASGACTTATGACTEWVQPPGHKSRVLVHRSHPLDVRNDRVRRALVFVHGIKRDAEDHFRTALAAAFLSDALEDTVIVAPRFASSAGGRGNESGDCHDALAPDEANWVCEVNRPDTWRSGGVALGPDRLSSFDVLDEIVRRLARKETFPNLKSIVIAGHRLQSILLRLRRCVAARRGHVAPDGDARGAKQGLDLDSSAHGLPRWAQLPGLRCLAVWIEEPARGARPDPAGGDRVTAGLATRDVPSRRGRRPAAGCVRHFLSGGGPGHLADGPSHRVPCLRQPEAAWASCARGRALLLAQRTVHLHVGDRAPRDVPALSRPGRSAGEPAVLLEVPEREHRLSSPLVEAGEVVVRLGEAGV